MLLVRIGEKSEEQAAAQYLVIWQGNFVGKSLIYKLMAIFLGVGVCLIDTIARLFDIV